MNQQKNPVSVVPAHKDHCQELLAYAQTQAIRMELSAETSCNIMESCISHMFNEYGRLVQQKFLLFWWERREFFWKLYHLKFFRFQITMLRKGTFLLSTQEYAYATGDVFSNGLYAETLPTLDQWHHDALHRIVGRQRTLLQQFSIMH